MFDGVTTMYLCTRLYLFIDKSMATHHQIDLRERERERGNCSDVKRSNRYSNCMGNQYQM